jgi:DNA helicase-2/ATP-dependent DNA helicase PcrA
VTTSHAKADIVYHEVAQFIKQLKKNKIITDYNQVAFLFPAMKGWRGMNSRVHGYIKAFQEENIPYYAPRAGRFLEVEEAQAVFGLFQFVFGKPLYRDREDASRGYREFQNWLAGCREKADELRKDDSQLNNYLKDREKEFQQAKSDYESLLEQCKKQNIDLKDSVAPGLTAILSKSAGLSLHGQKALRSHSVNQSIKKHFDEGNAYSIKYLLNRVSALDWSILDLFYQLNGFDYFRTIYKLSETGEDEGPICNLGLITQYLARYMEEYSPILTGQSVIENRFVNNFFGSFLYALFRLGESEYEDTEDPFPKGRVPFLTIHQSKGLELPVVVLGSVYREERDPSVMETSVRVLLKKEGEPLNRISKYDSMRLFYVGLSRAQNLLILPRYTHNKAASPEFKEIFEEGKLSELRDLELSSIPKAKRKFEELGKSYNYTGDYLLYKKCPRNYMIYRKYGFVPSRGQTMFFGRLIHETIEDLHHIIMKQKKVNK